MSNAIFSLPESHNEPILPYAPGSKERALLKAELERQYALELDIPLVIGGKEVRTGKTQKAVCPHDHQHVLAQYHEAGEAEVRLAIDAAMKAKKQWEADEENRLNNNIVAGYQLAFGLAFCFFEGRYTESPRVGIVIRGQ